MGEGAGVPLSPPSPPPRGHPEEHAHPAGLQEGERRAAGHGLVQPASLPVYSWGEVRGVPSRRRTDFSGTLGRRRNDFQGPGGKSRIFSVC